MTLVYTLQIILLFSCLKLSPTEWVEIPQNVNFKEKEMSRTPKIKPIIRFETNLNHTTERPKTQIADANPNANPNTFKVSKSVQNVESEKKIVKNVDKIITIEKSFPMNGFLLSGLMPYIEHLQEKVLKHLPKGITNKIRMLERYRDNLFASIEQRVRNFWPPLRSRQRRTLKDHHGHHEEHGDDHMAFPSAEGALITISFLTFSLFLTKLVLQVIQVLKAKQYNNNQLGVQFPQMGFMTANNIKEGRNARKFSTSDIHRYEHILRSISPH